MLLRLLYPPKKENKKNTKRTRRRRRRKRSDEKKVRCLTIPRNVIVENVSQVGLV